MSFLAGLGPVLGSVLFGGVGGLLGLNKKKPIVARPLARRDPDIEQVESADALRRRKGAAADMITGTRGAEAAAGSVGRLVVGS